MRFWNEEEEKRRITNMLNCQLGELPMNYLGIPISGTKLGKVDFAEVPQKISRRIPPWKGKNMSSGGRLILSNGCLSSMLTYIMGFYLLPSETHRSMNTIRSRFFWRGAGDDFKYMGSSM
jgi:hypothetical protein